MSQINTPASPNPAAPDARKPGVPGAARPSVPGSPTAPRPTSAAVTGAGGLPPIEQLQGRPLGRVLQKMGKVTREQYQEALSFQKDKGGALGRILIDLGYIKEQDLKIALAAQKGNEFFEVSSLKPDTKDLVAEPPQTA